MAVADSIGGLQRSRELYDLTNLQTSRQNAAAQADALARRDAQARQYFFDNAQLADRARAEAEALEDRRFNRDLQTKYFDFQKDESERDDRAVEAEEGRAKTARLLDLEHRLSQASATGKIPNERVLMESGGSLLAPDALARVLRSLGGHQAESLKQHNLDAEGRGAELNEQFQSTPGVVSAAGNMEAARSHFGEFALKLRREPLVAPNYQSGSFLPRPYAGDTNAIRHFQAPNRQEPIPAATQPTTPPPTPSPAGPLLLFRDRAGRIRKLTEEQAAVEAEAGTLMTPFGAPYGTNETSETPPAPVPDVPPPSIVEQLRQHPYFGTYFKRPPYLAPDMAPPYDPSLARTLPPPEPRYFGSSIRSRY